MSSLNGLKAWGRDRNSATTSPSCWYWPRRKLQGTGNMVYRPCGWTLVRPGYPPWRKGLGNWPPGPPMDLIGLMPWCGYMKAPTMCHSPRKGTWASYLREDRGNSQWANQPTGSLPTPHCWPTSCLPNRVEWMWRTHYNLPTGATGQWPKSYCRWAHLPGNQHPTIPSRGAGPKGTASWQGLHHSDSQPP